jgi:pimeloyl-ACP methyl ester carboxylesterase
MRNAVAVVLDIRYARSSGVSIAYQVVGEGETDLVCVPDYVSNLVYWWESDYWRPFYERLARSFRLILFDKRGTGLSDRGGSFPTLETRMEDVRAVMDAVGSERAAIFGAHEGCLMATLFAATYPEKTHALALFHPSHTGAREPREPDVDDLPTLREGWGTQEWCDALLKLVAPSFAGSEEMRYWFANELRVGASPAMAYELNRAFEDTDLRDVYAVVRVPTLVLYRDTPLAAGESLAVAAEIPGAGHASLGNRLLGPVHVVRRRRRARALRRRRDRPGRAGQRADHAPLHRHRELDRARVSTRRPGLARSPGAAPCSGAPRARTVQG